MGCASALEYERRTAVVQTASQPPVLPSATGSGLALVVPQDTLRRGLFLSGLLAVPICVVTMVLLAGSVPEHAVLAPWMAAGVLVLLGLVLVRQTLVLRDVGRGGRLLCALHERNLALCHANSALETLASTDALTGLPNRLRLCTELDARLQPAGSNDGPLAILLLDLDRFKQVNDTLGHYLGDLLLQEVAARLREAVRDTDVVARQGGDEFAVLLPRTELAVATHVAHRLIHAIESPFLIDGQAIDIGVSVGMALCPDHADRAPSLLQCADHAMYRAKRSHAGCCLYDPALDVHSATTQALVSELSQAIDGGQLILHYQPQVDRQTKQAYAVEALVRWNHPTRGCLEPAQFIPLAEDTGIIVPLAYWVLDQALRQCRLWQDAGECLSVAVNLSSRNLRDPFLARRIRDLLLEHQVAAHKLCIELTESSIMRDVQQTINVLRNLHSLGVRISLDDFGTGYSVPLGRAEMESRVPLRGAHSLHAAMNAIRLPRYG
jgi:diguanylate cyclase (GGDEF)-like protein